MTCKFNSFLKLNARLYPIKNQIINEMARQLEHSFIISNTKTVQILPGFSSVKKGKFLNYSLWTKNS